MLPCLLPMTYSAEGIDTSPAALVKSLLATTPPMQLFIPHVYSAPLNPITLLCADPQQICCVFHFMNWMQRGKEIDWKSPWPSCPRRPLPQLYTLPVSAKAKVKSSPTATDVMDMWPLTDLSMATESVDCD